MIFHVREVTTAARHRALRERPLEDLDPAVAGLIAAEAARRRDGLNLVASENEAWPAVVAVLASAPHDKYSEGYPGTRYHGGCEVVDELEQLAVDRAKALFDAGHANVQPHAGAPATLGVHI